MVLRIALVTGALLLAAARAASAQDAPPDGWAFKGELTSVLSAGNAEAFTFGLGSSVENRQGKNLLKLEAGGLRTESVLVSREAVGTPSNFRVLKNEDREKTADSYFARARYDRALNDRMFVLGGVDWLRNTFAGIDSRSLVALGAGNIWLDRENVRLRTSYAATYTFQTDVVENPAVADRFGGARVGWEYWQKLTASTELESRLVSDLNLDETDDIRGDLTTALTVAMSSALALKPSLQVLWRNLPSLTAVPLFSSTGANLNQDVLTPLEKTDLLFRLALVVKL
jgi:putative salt-induced outer membrane protein YdiY